MRSQKTLCFALLASTCLISPRASALDLPSAPSVAHGSVGITTPNASTISIQQGSPTAIVNWQSFSVGSGARVDIQQPSSSSTLLNRVTGQTTSTIAGSINANGQVYLVNPNGIVITPTGTVKAGGGFVASTLGTTDEDFIAGRRNFTGNGNSAAVTNQGAIEVGRGGYAALIGGAVDNSGTISVPLGRVGLGAGERATLDISGDGFLQVALPSGSPGKKVLIQHSGRITANGGRVEIKAATAREAARQAINLSGVVEARSVRGRSGAIVLGGGDGGAVNVSGRLDASATRQARNAQTARNRAALAAKGGEIAVTGDMIKLAGATIDASGRQGGGSVRIGGDYQGKGALQRARSLEIDAGTQITADATQAGDGGRVILWSDAFTSFAGLIRARGGEEAGNGGFAEVSSKGILSYDGSAVLTAAKGNFGTLLLDPYNITISTGANTSGFTATTNDSVINVTTLQNALATANVEVYTGGTGSTSGFQAGNITVAAPISWAAPTRLTLRADGDIAINQAITAPQGSLAISSVTSTATAAVNVNEFFLTRGSWEQVSTALPAFSANTFNFFASDGSTTGPIGGSFIRALGGNGSVATPYLIADIYGLQGIDSSTITRSSNYALTNDIDATITRSWRTNRGVESASRTFGFQPIGSRTSAAGTNLPFSGTLDGRGRTISNLYSDSATLNPAATTGVNGLVGVLTGSISNLNLQNVDIAAPGQTGALVGLNQGGQISRVVSSGTVRSLSSDAGGLVGENTGSVTHSNSSASVSSSLYAGGLVGFNSGTVANSYSTGALTKTQNTTSLPSAVGGLVGFNNGQVSQSYFAGTLTSTETGPLVGLIGGVVGSNDADGTLTGLFFDTTRAGTTTGVGNAAGATGVTGLTTGVFQDTASFVPVARTRGWNFETTWAPPSTGFYPELYATSPIIRVVNDGVTRPYGGSNSIPLLASYGGPNAFVFGRTGDTVDLTNSLTSAASVTSPVGPYAIGGVNQISTQGVSYRVVATQTDAALTPSLTVTTAPLTITASNQLKGYGASYAFAGTEFSATGLQNGERVGSATLSSVGASATANVGLYPILVASIAGGTFAASNYTITYVPGTMTVTPAPLTVTANNSSKIFGSGLVFTGTEFTARGLQNGETIGTTMLASDGAAAAASIGVYPIRIGNAAGGTFNPANYTIAYVNGTLTVAGAVLPPSAILDDDLLRIANAEAGVPARQLPITTIALPNPTDSIDFGGAGGSVGGGPTLGTGQTVTLQSARTTLAAVESSARTLEKTVTACGTRFTRANAQVTGYTDCVGDALDQFASALDTRSLTLPGPMQGVSAVIRQAAREVRAARTVQEARVAVGKALTEVRKAIALIRADDPTIGRLQLQQGNRIASALGSVELKLSRAGGL